MPHGMLRIHYELYGRIRALAAQRRRPIAWEVSAAIERHLREAEAEMAAGADEVIRACPHPKRARRAREGYHVCTACDAVRLPDGRWGRPVTED